VCAFGDAGRPISPSGGSDGRRFVSPGRGSAAPLFVDLVHRGLDGSARAGDSGFSDALLSAVAVQIRLDRGAPFQFWNLCFCRCIHVLAKRSCFRSVHC
jgi:hypothetical protein